MINWNKYSTEPTNSNLLEYPTIIDVVEDILNYENANTQLSMFPLAKDRTWLYKMEEPGHYMAVHTKDDMWMVDLCPTGRCPFTLDRGESQCYSSCTPSLLRTKDEKEILRSYLQTAELECIIKQHPVISNFFLHDIYHPQLVRTFRLEVQYEGLAQHYGILTPQLDLTNDKWVAAFFAITNFRNGIYEVVEPTGDQRCGKLYRCKNIDFNDSNRMHPKPLGMQYFNRPGKQSAYTLDMRNLRDLNLYPGIECIYFRHDNYANQLLFDLCQQGRRYFPDDSLVEIVKQLKISNSFSEEAVEITRVSHYPKMSRKEMKAYLHQYSIDIILSSKIGFDKNRMKKDWELWQNGEKQRYLNDLLIFPISKNILSVRK